MISGVQIISTRVIDARRTLVIGMGILTFLLVAMFPRTFADAPYWLQPIVSSPLVLATIVALTLNLLFRIGIKRSVEMRIATPKTRRAPERHKTITIEGACEHNLRDLDVEIPLGLFVAVQLADAVQTVSGISQFGLAIEANPLLSFCAAVFGAGAALVVAKTVAIIGGATLHIFSQHFILAALTVACVFGALVPWAMILNW